MKHIVLPLLISTSACISCCSSDIAPKELLIVEPSRLLCMNSKEPISFFLEKLDAPYKDFNDLSELYLAEYIAIWKRDINQLHFSEHSSVFNLSREFFIRNLFLFEQLNIISAVASIPRADRSVVVDFAKSFMTEDMYAIDKVQILRAVTKIQQADYQPFIEFIKRLLRGRIKEAELANIVVNAALIPADQRQLFVNCFNTLHTLDTKSCRAEDIALFLRKIPADQRAVATEQAKSLLTEVNDAYQAADIMRVLADITDSNQRESIIRFSKALMMKAGGKNLSVIMHALYYMPVEQREAISTLAKPLCADINNGFDSSLIVYALVQIPADEREAIIDLARPLFTSVQNISSAIDIIWHLPAVDRESVIDALKPLAIDKLAELNLGFIIKAVYHIPVNERAARVQRAKEKMDLNLPSSNTYFRNRLIQILALPLDQPISPLPDTLRPLYKANVLA
jgi:hypothetical protein